MQPGLYERLVTLALAQDLESLADPRLFATAPIDPEDSHAAIAQFLEHVLAGCLATFRGEEANERQRRLADRVLELLLEELGDEWEQRLTIATPLRRLLAIHANPDHGHHDRPDTPLARSALLTGTRLDPSLGSQLRKEILTADRVDILCSFVKWSGLRVILEPLRELAEKNSPDGPRIRVITTSYMGRQIPRPLKNSAVCIIRLSGSVTTPSVHGFTQKRICFTATRALAVPMSDQRICRVPHCPKDLNGQPK